MLRGWFPWGFSLGKGLIWLFFTQSVVPVIYQIMLLSLDVLLQANIFKTQTCDCYHHEPFGVYLHFAMNNDLLCCFHRFEHTYSCKTNKNIENKNPVHPKKLSSTAEFLRYQVICHLLCQMCVNPLVAPCTWGTLGEQVWCCPSWGSAGGEDLQDLWNNAGDCCYNLNIEQISMFISVQLHQSVGFSHVYFP